MSVFNISARWVTYISIILEKIFMTLSGEDHPFVDRLRVVRVAGTAEITETITLSTPSN